MPQCHGNPTDPNGVLYKSIASARVYNMQVCMYEERVWKVLKVHKTHRSYSYTPPETLQI
jgi:hypothetical protein